MSSNVQSSFHHSTWETSVFQANPLVRPPLQSFHRILANPPFGGAIDRDQISPQLTGTKTEVLFTDLVLQTLTVGGQAAVIVPGGFLFGRNKAHKVMRQRLIESHRLSHIITLPKGTFQQKPPRWTKQRAKIGTGIVAYILVFSQTGITEIVRFCEISDPNTIALREDDSDCICWSATRAEIVANEYDLSPNRYQPYEKPVPLQPIGEIWDEIKQLEAQIAQTGAELDLMLADLGFVPQTPIATPPQKGDSDGH